MLMYIKRVMIKFDALTVIKFYMVSDLFSLYSKLPALKKTFDIFSVTMSMIYANIQQSKASLTSWLKGYR